MRWACSAQDITTQSTTNAYTKQTATSATSVTLSNFTDIAGTGAWTAGDKLLVKCAAF
jgi:hypothetical protein